ncbi:MAG: metal-dependent transcriptional regulator [Christensenellaceae bacterium]
MENQEISASSQDYLEIIYTLYKSGIEVRSVDIATAMGVSRASISKAMGVLKNAGMVMQEKYGRIMLTTEGMAAAKKVIRTHETLKSFLVDVLGVSEKIAQQDACKMEHSISPETLKKLISYLHKDKA